MKKFCLILLGIFFFSLVSSQSVQTLGYFKNGNDISLTQICSNCSYVNISSVNYPNMSVAVSEVEMSKVGIYFNYVLSGDYTQEFGKYIVCGYGDLEGSVTAWCYDFFVNGTGRAEPSGAVVTLFIVSFLIVLFLFVWLFVYSLGHAIKKDFDVVDLGFDFGIYFALLGLYILQQQYLGNPVIDNILFIFVYVGAFTHIFAASIFFFISLFRASAERTRSILTGGMR